MRDKRIELQAREKEGNLPAWLNGKLGREFRSGSNMGQ